MLDKDSISEIRQIFIEEADEGLDIMESGLLVLNEGDDSEREHELINDIFRAAHSIKGGSATFGFSQVSEFTHLMETLLDEIRAGSRTATPDCIQALLESVDCLRGMMTAVKDGCEFDNAKILEAATPLKHILADEITAQSSTAGSEATEACVSENAVNPTSSGGAGWEIEFKPALDVLKKGNDPARLLRELTALGELEVAADTSCLPSLDALDPESCYIGWKLNLISPCSREEVEEVFDWVVDESHLSIIPLHGNDGESAYATEAPANQQTDTSTNPMPSVQPDPMSRETKSSKRPSSPALEAKKVTATANTVSTRRDNGSIRVGIDKIDSLLNLVGELVITQAILNRHTSDEHGGTGTTQSALQDGLAQLETNARELQDVAMKMRMLPINTTFARFPRLVHDLSLQLGKKVDLQIIGEHTELDKTVLEKIGDPLVHLVRNALDHGIETPQLRIKAGKPETAVLSLRASHEAGNIIIEVSDDGSGLDHEKIKAKAIEQGLIAVEDQVADEAIPYLIFQPGFSTAEAISDVSGRGVGMDVVKRNIQDLGGHVDVKSQYGIGSTFSIRLPLTLAILDGQLVRIRENTYVVPLLSIIETVVVDKARLNIVAAESMVYRLRNDYIPVISMVDALGINHEQEHVQPEVIEGKLMVIVEFGTRVVGLVVDDLLDQQQVVLKSLDTNYQQIVGVTGATILGDGTVSLIIDIQGIIESSLGTDDQTALRDVVAA